MSRVEHFKSIIGDMVDTFECKNADYGDAIFDLGPVGAVIGLHHKLKRIMTIDKNKIQVESETIKDTLLDAANYAIIALMAIEIAEGLESHEDEMYVCVEIDDGEDEFEDMTDEEREEYEHALEREERIDKFLLELFPKQDDES